MAAWPPRAIIRRDTGTRALEGALRRRLGPVAGVDEAGRGASAGPLVVAACILPERAHTKLPGLDDSKVLSEKTRERLYPRILAIARSTHIVSIPPDEIDERGVHVCNIEGMRRAAMGLDPQPGYVLTDGFPVPGIPWPSLAVISGDASAACIAAASVLAKVTRDRIMAEMDDHYPGYGFARHKGYSTASHMQEIVARGVTPLHRTSYANVAEASRMFRARHAHVADGQA